jgi:hypothetical protein
MRTINVIGSTYSPSPIPDWVYALFVNIKILGSRSSKEKRTIIKNQAKMIKFLKNYS